MEENSESGFVPDNKHVGSLPTATYSLICTGHAGVNSLLTLNLQRWPRPQWWWLHPWGRPTFQVFITMSGSLTCVINWLLIQIFFDWTPMLNKLSELLTEIGTLYLSVQFNHSVVSDSAIPWTAAHQASLSMTNTRSPPKPMSIKWVRPSNHLILCCPLSCPQSFPASRSFPRSQLFTSGGQSIGVSASTLVLSMNTQDWSPLGWTDWISLQSKGLSGVFSNAVVQKHQFFWVRFLYSPTLTSIHDRWKNHSLDYMELCWQSNVSAF